MVCTDASGLLVFERFLKGFQRGLKVSERTISLGKCGERFAIAPGGNQYRSNSANPRPSDSLRSDCAPVASATISAIHPGTRGVNKTSASDAARVTDCVDNVKSGFP